MQSDEYTYSAASQTCLWFQLWLILLQTTIENDVMLWFCMLEKIWSLLYIFDKSAAWESFILNLKFWITCWFDFLFFLLFYLNKYFTKIMNLIKFQEFKLFFLIFSSCFSSRSVFACWIFFFKKSASKHIFLMQTAYYIFLLKLNIYHESISTVCSCFLWIFYKLINSYHSQISDCWF